jgi:hypothetical protein
MEKTTQLRNPITHKFHRRETIWQIIAPLVVGISIILGLGIWAIVTVAQGGDVSQAADTSLIFLLIPVLILSLIPLALLGGLVYGMFRLLKILPPKFYLVQGLFLKVQERVKQGADIAVEPILRINSIGAGWQTFKRILNENKTIHSREEGVFL